MALLGVKDMIRTEFGNTCAYFALCSGTGGALGEVSLGEDDFSISNGSDIHCDLLDLSSAFNRMRLLRRSGPAHATRTCGPFPCAHLDQNSQWGLAWNPSSLTISSDGMGKPMKARSGQYIQTSMSR